MTKEKALRAIRNAWICGIISGSMTLLLMIISLAGVEIPNRDLGLWTLIDVAIIFGLSYGISRKSRFCSTTVFIYFALTKIYHWIHLNNLAAFPLTLVFIYFYYQGMRGTYIYHKLIKEEKAVDTVQDVQ